MATSKINPYSILLDDEARLIDKTRTMREEMVDGFIKEKGLPVKTGEMRVINEILNSLDTQVLGMVDKRLKHEDNVTSGNLTETIKEVFLELEKRANNVDVKNKVVEISDKYIPDDIVDGEDSIEYQELELSDYIGNKDEV